MVGSTRSQTPGGLIWQRGQSGGTAQKKRARDVPPVACPPTSPVLALQPLHHAKAEVAAFGPPSPLDSLPCLTVGLPCAEEYDGAEKAPVNVPLLPKVLCCV